MTQELIERLEPCPFCRAEPEDCPQNSERPHPHRKGEWCVYIWCDNCDARGPEKRDQAEAIAAWNTRDQSQSARIAELDAECEHAWAAYRMAHDQAMSNGQALADLRFSLTKDSTSG